MNRPPNKRRALEKGLETLQAMREAGEKVNESILAKRAGISPSSAHHVFVVAEYAAKIAKAQGRVTAVEGHALEAATVALTPKQKVSLETTIQAHKRRLEREFEARVSAEVRRRIDSADSHVRKSLEDAKRTVAGLEKILRGKGVFSMLEYRQLQMAVHPDSTASAEVRNRLIDIIVKNDTLLIKRD